MRYIILFFLFLAGCKRENRLTTIKTSICSSEELSLHIDSAIFNKFKQTDYVMIGLYDNNEWLFFSMNKRGHSLKVISFQANLPFNPRNDKGEKERVLNDESKSYEIMTCITRATPKNLIDFNDTTIYISDPMVSSYKVYYGYGSWSYKASETYYRDYYIDVADSTLDLEIKEFARKIYNAALLLRHYPSVEIPVK